MKSQNSQLNNNIACLVLASGKSTRFGSQKLLANFFENKKLVECTLKNYCDVFSKVVLVASDDVIQSIDVSRGSFDYVTNFHQDKGISYSIKLGIEFLMNEVQSFKSCAIALGDMPLVKTETLRALADLEAEKSVGDDPYILSPAYEGVRGHPVFFSHHFYNDLMLLKGDLGAKPIIKGSQKWFSTLEVEDRGVVFDIDYKVGLVEARELLNKRAANSERPAR